MRVDLAALERGQGELGRDEDGGAESEQNDGKQAEHAEKDPGHRMLPRSVSGSGWQPGDPGSLLQPGDWASHTERVTP
ncbi:hypothetical protein GCM10012275_29460 [Longimycelium tulufanense]|uniref:Uncharacterized protein n=1 Tax=Longimycelium tulufanense TaxID=907463 RepID=A0A8J3CER0_9PSEU|nr:hypothetical protein GCM10012275_29460 [Longimycelium tulufanense]